MSFRLCLSISDFHPDTWNPAWSVSTILTGLLSFMVSCNEPVAFSISAKLMAYQRVSTGLKPMTSLCSVIAQSVEHCTSITEVFVFESC